MRQLPSCYAQDADGGAGAAPGVGLQLDDQGQFAPKAFVGRDDVGVAGRFGVEAVVDIAAANDEAGAALAEVLWR